MTSAQRPRTRHLCGSAQPTAWMPRPRVHPDPADPWRVVERRQTGLLRYARARGTMALPVHYIPRDHRIYFRLPEYNDASHFIDRADVALEVDAATTGRVVVVRVGGVGLLISPAAVPTDVSEALDEWPSDVATSMIVLVPESVQRVSLTDNLRYPPLPAGTATLPGTFTDPYGAAR